MAENDGHSDSFQVKFPNVFTNYPLGAVRVEDQRFKDWDHYKFIIWQSQLNFVVFCVSSACGVSVEHLNTKEPMIRSIYRFHVYYHIRDRSLFMAGGGGVGRVHMEFHDISYSPPFILNVSCSAPPLQ